MKLSQNFSGPHRLPDAMPKPHTFQVGESSDPRCLNELSDLGPKALDIKVTTPIPLSWFSTLEGFHVQALSLGGAYIGTGSTPHAALVALQQSIAEDVRLFKLEPFLGKRATDFGHEWAERLARFVDLCPGTQGAS